MKMAKRKEAERQLRAAGWTCRLLYGRGGERIYIPPNKVGYLFFPHACRILLEANAVSAAQPQQDPSPPKLCPYHGSYHPCIWCEKGAPDFNHPHPLNTNLENP